MVRCLKNFQGQSKYEQRWKVRRALEKSKPAKPNISKVERLAIKLLQDDNTIIHPAMVMDRVEYSNNWIYLIGNSCYCKVKKNPTLKTEMKPSQILVKNKDYISKKNRQLTYQYRKLPHRYSFLKMHKDHHHHLIPPARISLTLSHRAAVCIFELVSSLLLGHNVGVHGSTSLRSSSLLLQQCPACLIRLTWIVFVNGR